MSTDVRHEALIHRPLAEVAAYALDPANDPQWIGGIVESTPVEDGPIGLGSRVRRLAKFMGKRIDYETEVIELDPAGVVEMRTSAGPFPMRIRYEFREADGGTLASVRVRGDAGGFYRLAAPLLNATVKRNLRRDFRTLKRLLER